MSACEPTSAAPAGNWIANQPYLLLNITAMCWAGNAIVGRLARARPPPRGPHRAGDAVIPALVACVPDHPAVCLETSGARLGRDPLPPRNHDRAFDHRHRRLQHPAILGARAYPGAEHAVAAIRGAAVRRDLVAAA